VEIGQPEPLAGMDESVVDASRHYRCLRGDEFVDELELPRWDWRSVWGFDNHHRSYFAALWRNGSRAPVPDICLSGGHARVYWWPGCIALELLAIAEHDPTTVVRAMSIADPAPRVRPREEIAREAERVSRLTDNPFYHGNLDALRWAMGDWDMSPGSHQRWPGEAPTPKQVDAEHHLVVGRVYDYDQIQDQIPHGGAEAALWWALGRE
jgi:hypothetical protein